MYEFMNLLESYAVCNSNKILQKALKSIKTKVEQKLSIATNNFSNKNNHRKFNCKTFSRFLAKKALKLSNIALQLFVNISHPETTEKVTKTKSRNSSSDTKKLNDPPVFYDSKLFYDMRLSPKLREDRANWINQSLEFYDRQIYFINFFAHSVSYCRSIYCVKS